LAKNRVSTGCPETRLAKNRVSTAQKPGWQKTGFRLVGCPETRLAKNRVSTGAQKPGWQKTGFRLFRWNQTPRNPVGKKPGFLTRRFSVLRDEKVARDDMAEILFELGMRLKGTEFVPELKEVAEGNIEPEVLLPQRRQQ
jgi:hypothetical protein